MSRIPTVVVLALTILLTSSAVSMAQQQTSVDDLMQQKLLSSQALLKGLAVEDFDLIAKQAQKLHLLSRDVSWNILQTKEYVRLSDEFRFAAEQIRDAGTSKNLDAAALGYFKLTMTCVDCHRHIRSTD